MVEPSDDFWGCTVLSASCEPIISVVWKSRLCFSSFSGDTAFPRPWSLVSISLSENGLVVVIFADQAGAVGTAAALCLRDQQNEDKDCFVPLALIFFFLNFFSFLF